MDTPLFYSTAAGFIVLTGVMYMLVFQELKKALTLVGWDEARKKRIYNRSLYTMLGWTIFISTLALTGFLQNFNAFPPRIMITLIVPVIALLFITFSKTFKELLPHIQQKTIVRLQVFRLFVEILLWMLFIQNLLPIQMSFEGRNFDIVAGVTAPFAAYFLANNRKGLLIWNLVSFGLLMNIIIIAVLSVPSPLRVFMNEPANTMVTHFPFVWLPGLLVPLAYGLHFFSLRRLAVVRETEHTVQTQNVRPA